MSRNIHFLLNHNGILKDVFQLSYNRRDASLYFFISGQCREYRYGMFEFPEGVSRTDINCNAGHFSKKVPKLSYHQSGAIHIKHECQLLQLKKTAFDNLRWTHILSVVVSSVDQLPVRKNISRNDVIVETFNYDCSCFIIYASNQGQLITVPIDREFKHPECDLKFGYRHVNQLSLNTTGAGGIILFTGWTVDQQGLIRDSGLFIQGIP